MLAADEPVRAYHREMKSKLAMHDMLVVGVVNEQNPAGVFNQQSLANIRSLTEYAKTLRWTADDGTEEGIIGADILSPSTIDNIEQGELGSVRFEWLMGSAPSDRAEAETIRDSALRLPMLNGTMVSDDGKAMALYLPITSKDVSYRVFNALEEKIAELGGEEKYHITGLPVAENAFGVEMFIQMAISAPAAMLIIFALLWYFFRNLILISASMLFALVSVVVTVTALVLTGNTVHIMSSMIPIFIMPIAVLDSVHILSQFYDRYQKTRGRVETVRSVVRDLFRPMLFTSLTTAAGFASLALTPIPPVQVFGVMVAWFLTITFLPAYVARMSETTLASFGMQGGTGGYCQSFRIAAALDWMGCATCKYAKTVLLLALLVSMGAAVGIGRIQVNDNPIRWFSPDHEIRVADQVLNRHFGGSYMAYLALTPTRHASARSYLNDLHGRTQHWAAQEDCKVIRSFSNEVGRLLRQDSDPDNPAPYLEGFAETKATSTSGKEADAWERVLEYLARESERRQVFKDPGVLNYIAGLQQHLETMATVGKTSTAADMTKTIRRELLGGDDDQYRIPNSSRAVAQTLLTCQNSHRPQDLWHFLTTDFRTAAIWIQMKRGDNADMARPVETVDRYFVDHPPPTALAHEWFGLTYINSVWQEKMVNGMLEALAGSFIVVFLMMMLLMRSAIWALLGMLPLAVTLAAIYGAIELLGKDYDMPVAVLSALSLGLAVDFAIHFLEQARKKVAERGSWKAAASLVFGAPARAITRNGLVVAIGFLPLLAAPLVPYQTVGTLIASILAASGIATLMVLPALIGLLEPWLFRGRRHAQGVEISAPVVQAQHS